MIALLGGGRFSQLMGDRSGFNILLRNGVRKEGGVLALRLEGRFKGSTLFGIRESGLGSLCRGFQSCLTCLYFGVLVVFDGVQQIDT